MKKFDIIGAVSLNGVIGDSVTNSMPWYIPCDLKRFKSITFNKTVVMGSRTYESIGKPLKDRFNVVITRSKEQQEKYLSQGVDACYESFKEAHSLLKEGFIVIGGEHIYREAIKMIPSSFIMTIVEHNIEGDVHFPIAGHRFLNGTLTLNNSTIYGCRRLTESFTENDFNFRYATFTRY